MYSEERICLKSIKIRNIHLNEHQLSLLIGSIFRTQHLSLLFSPVNGAEGFRVLFESIITAWKKDARKQTDHLLKSLEIVCCDLDDHQLIMIAKAIPLVEAVDLSGNRSLSTRGIKMMAEEIKNAQAEARREGRSIKLSTLRLCNCNIDEQQFQCLAEVIPYLNTVDLSHNKWTSTAGFKVLKREISKGTFEGRQSTLKTLDLSFCELNRNQLILLAKCFPNRNTVIVDDSRSYVWKNSNFRITPRSFPMKTSI